MFWKRKEVVTIDTVAAKIKPVIAGGFALFTKLNTTSGVLSLRDVRLMLFTLYNNKIEVKISIDADPHTVGRILDSFKSLSWIVHHTPFIQTENDTILLGDEARQYYETREILNRSIPGMVFIKEQLC